MKVLHFVVFWTQTPCSLVGYYQCFEGTSCFCLLLWRQYVPLDPCHLPVRLCDIIPVNYSTSCLHVGMSFLWSCWLHSCSTCILWNPKVHSCVHRSLLHALILRQREPVPSYLCRVILILSFHLCLGLISSCLHTKTLYVFLFSPLHLIFLALSFVILFEGEYKSWILSFHLCLGLISSCLHTKTLYVFLFSPVHLIFLALSIIILFEGEYKSWSSLLHTFSPASHYFLPLGPKFFSSALCSRTLRVFVSVIRDQISHP